MGGCRCTFRNCENSTQNNPAMHFFHFPFRDLQRCEKWAQYSNNLAFLRLPINQLRNKVVCETHFKEPCFMNIKRERLTKFAVPTLLRTKTGEVVDYEIDEKHPTIYEVEATKTSRYCEPPSQPIKLLNNMVPSARCLRKEDTLTVTGDLETFEYAEMGQSQDDITNVMSERSIESEASEPTILNGITLTKVDINRYSNDENEVTDTTAITLKRKLQPIIKQEIRTESVTVKQIPSQINYDADNIEFYDHSAKRSKIVDTILTDDTSPVAQNLPDNAIDKTLFLETMEKQLNQIVDLKQIITEKIDKLEELHKESKSEQPVVITAQDKSRYFIEAGPTKAKIQLFNGIKKYLNPSMVALLRMEMFGDTERQYKSDEKSLAVELLNVQNNIYEYMRSELRFRLPPKRDAECWAREMSENGREIDWEDEF